jgi:hypothetical protein
MRSFAIPTSMLASVVATVMACQGGPPAQNTSTTIDVRASRSAPLAVTPDNAGTKDALLRRLAEPASSAYVRGDGGALVSVGLHCMLDDDGAWSCQWGEASPIRIGGIGAASELVAGHAFVCALERSGRVACLNTLRTEATAGILALPFRVKRIAGNEHSVIVEADDGRVHECELPFDPDGPFRECELTALAVPDVDAYVHAPLRRCSLDRERKASCRGRASENSDEEQNIALPGFPKKVRRLVEGLGAYETGAVVCAIGSAGELVCYRGLHANAHDELVADVERIALPVPVRDLAIGDSYGRAVLEDGSVFEIPMSLTRRYPRGAKMFVATHVPTSEPAESISAMSCIRYRSGRVGCGRQ